MVHLDTKKKLSKPSTNCTPVKSESLMHPGAPVKPNPMSFPVKVAMDSFPKEIICNKPWKGVAIVIHLPTYLEKTCQWLKQLLILLGCGNMWKKIIIVTSG